jgi:hypothetical protein
MSGYEILSLIIQGIGLLSLFLLVRQIREAKETTEEARKATETAQQAQREHNEELRRVKTIEVLANWNNSLKKESRLAEKIVETFDKEQCKQLYDYNSFSVNEKAHNMICQMCSKRNTEGCKDCKKNDNGSYEIDGIVLTELRGNVTNYLNNLEIVALAWKQAIVDKDAIVTQFSFLHTPGVKSALANYRDVAGGGNSFPALADFYEEIKKRSTTRLKNKDIQ